MPRYAIMSELHANWEALVAVYKSILAQREIRNLCILGDVIGYGPNPNEVIKGLKDIEAAGFNLQINMGGHDVAVLGDYEFVDLDDPADLERVQRETGLKTREEIRHAFRHKETRRYIPVRPEAKAALLWTKERLRPESVEFLRTRPEERTEIKPGVVCVHGSARDPVFEYVHDDRFATKSFEAREMDGVRLCFVGHTHQPMVWSARIDDRLSFAGKVILLSRPTVSQPAHVKFDFTSSYYIVNVGAVGQPRDGDPRSCYVVYDSDKEEIDFLRVPYDVERTKAKILEYGLPPILAKRLDQAT